MVEIVLLGFLLVIFITKVFTMNGKYKAPKEIDGHEKGNWMPLL